MLCIVHHFYENFENALQIVSLFIITHMPVHNYGQRVYKSLKTMPQYDYKLYRKVMPLEITFTELGPLKYMKL